MTIGFFARAAAASALLATAALMFGSDSAAAQSEPDKPFVSNEIRNDCREIPNTFCSFDIVTNRSTSDFRIEARYVHCFIRVFGEDAELPFVALTHTKGNEAGPRAFLVATKIETERVGNATFSGFVVAAETLYIADPGERIGISLTALNGIDEAACTLTGELVFRQ